MKAQAKVIDIKSKQTNIKDLVQEELPDYPDTAILFVVMEKILAVAEIKGLEVSPRAVKGLHDALDGMPEIMMQEMIDNPSVIEDVLEGEVRG